MNPKEAYDKARQAHTQAWEEYDEVYNQARVERRSANAKLREIYDNGLADTSESFDDAIDPKRKAFFEVAAVKMNEAREVFKASPPQVAYRARIKRADRILLGLYLSASVILLFAEITLGRMFVLITGTPWAQIVTIVLVIAVLIGGPLKLDLIHHKGKLFPPTKEETK